MELFVDNAGRQLLNSRASTERLDEVKLGEGTKEPLTIYLLNRPATAGLPLIASRLAAPFTKIAVAARKKSDLETGSELFTVADFARRGFGAITSSSAPAAVAIDTSSAANPTVIATSAPHGLADGDTVKITSHSGSVPPINETWEVTLIDASSFTIPANVTTAGTGGTFLGPAPRYDGLLDLSDSSVTTALAGEKTLALLIDVELQNDDNTRNRRVVMHSKGTLYRDIYRTA